MSSEVMLIPKEKLINLNQIRTMLNEVTSPSMHNEQQFYKKLFGYRGIDSSPDNKESFTSMTEVAAECEVSVQRPSTNWDGQTSKFCHLFDESASDFDHIASSISRILELHDADLFGAIVEKMDGKTFNCLCQYLMRDLEEPDNNDFIMVKDIVSPYTIKNLKVESKSQALVKLIIQLKTRYGAIVLKNIVVPALSERLLYEDVNLQQLVSNIGESQLAVDVLITLLKSRPNAALSDQDLNIIDGILNEFQELFSHPGVQSNLGPALEQSSSSHSKNTRFGKFLLNFIKKFQGPMDDKTLQLLHQSVINHSTFLKKALEQELKKKMP